LFSPMEVLPLGTVFCWNLFVYFACLITIILKYQW
jgi:hypothetical protein